MSKTYGVIPARSGSKGIPGKNKKDLAGKPLFWYTCVSALESGLDRVFLDTDDQEIIDYVSQHFPKISIPYVRPAALAQDDSTALDVALHFIEDCGKKGIEIPENIFWLQPTSPLRTSADIDHCIKLIGNHDSVVSVVDVGACHPFKVRIIKDGLLVPQDPTRAVGSSNRQQLPNMYICNGVVFLVKTRCLLEKRSFYGDSSLPYVMDRASSMNIDDELDFMLTELLLKKGATHG